ncbi:hypothetical protein FOC4_g10000348 [Fusarium odoratissimum]|uniref:Uncharacterized protein n=1 Tax=Fusarium oxysporum f. sp. cubense (strain race 4) TaxID=2502994 RepID=N1S680_FUSC4|nr:hypothetical protein FOC4_g10000348 [Fusarium odoratissimum]
MTGRAIYTDAIVTLRPSQLQKLETGWETTFENICRDILVALTELPNSRTDRPMPRGSSGGEVIYSLSRDERRLASMMATLDRRHDRRRHRETTLFLQGWLQDRLRLRREVFRGTQ